MTKKTMRYNAAVEELEEILGGLESEDVDIDEVSEKVRRAIDLIRLCKEKINKTELEVKKIVKEFDRDLDKASGD